MFGARIFRPDRRVALPLGLLITLGAGTAQAQYYPPEPPPPAMPWYDALDVDVFADAYASVNYAFPKPQHESNQLRAYDVTNGFALSWVGIDVAYEPDPVGATVGLRLGPTANIYANSCLSADTSRSPCDSDLGLQYVKQAYVSFRPGGPGSGLELDLGKFDTIYGAEVAESQNNYNYTRGLLYWLGQPLFHTGLRLSWEIMPELEFKALAVNGYNNSVDNNVGKTFGAQFGIHPTSTLNFYLGWLGGPEQDDTATVLCDAGQSYDPAQGTCVDDPGRVGMPASFQVIDRGGANQFDAWRHLLDLVATYEPTPDLGLVLNLDYGTEGYRESLESDHVSNKTWYGAMLAGEYAFDEVWAVGLRGEYYADPDGHTTGAADAELVSGTLTIDATLAEYLLVRLEGRGDFALNPDLYEPFYSSVRDTQSSQLTTTLGVVASSF